MADKHTHTYTGSPGYIHLLPGGARELAPGDKVTFPADAVDISAEFQPIGKAKAEPSPDTPQEG